MDRSNFRALRRAHRERVILAPCDKRGARGNRRDPARCAIQMPDLFTGSGVPEAHLAVAAERGENLAVPGKSPKAGPISVPQPLCAKPSESPGRQRVAEA